MARLAVPRVCSAHHPWAREPIALLCAAFGLAFVGAGGEPLLTRGCLKNRVKCGSTPLWFLPAAFGLARVVGAARPC